METVIETAEVKQKLETINLGEYYLDEFCRVLAKRLPEQTTPLGFLMAVTLLKLDAAKGDGLYIKGIGEPIRSRLSSIDIGFLVELRFKSIVDKVFPMDFAQELMRERQAVLDEAKAAQADEDALAKLLGK
jgi:hypothetical protein